MGRKSEKKVVAMKDLKVKKVVKGGMLACSEIPCRKAGKDQQEYLVASARDANLFS